MRQKLYCENCKKEFNIEYGEHEDVIGVFYLVTDEHDRVSPECETGLMWVRVIRPTTEREEE